MWTCRHCLPPVLSFFLLACHGPAPEPPAADTSQEGARSDGTAHEPSSPGAATRHQADALVEAGAGASTSSPTDLLQAGGAGSSPSKNPSLSAVPAGPGPGIASTSAVSPAESLPDSGTRAERDLFAIPPDSDLRETGRGLKYAVMTRGSGPQVKRGDTVKVHYTGWLTSGRQFDSSRVGDQPFSFQVGEGLVIDAWEEVLPLMRVGDKFTILSPPELAYGEVGVAPVIPPKATLVFSIEVVGLNQ